MDFMAFYLKYFIINLIRKYHIEPEYVEVDYRTFKDHDADFFIQINICSKYIGEPPSGYRPTLFCIYNNVFFFEAIRISTPDDFNKLVKRLIKEIREFKKHECSLLLKKIKGTQFELDYKYDPENDDQ